MGAAIAHIILGLWLMIAPAILNMNKQASDNNHIAGPLIITFAIVALWEINRNAIRINILVALWVLISVFIFDYSGIPLFSNLSAAFLVIILSFVKRKRTQRYGGGWRELFR